VNVFGGTPRSLATRMVRRSSSSSEGIGRLESFSEVSGVTRLRSCVLQARFAGNVEEDRCRHPRSARSFFGRSERNPSFGTEGSVNGKNMALRDVTVRTAPGTSMVLIASAVWIPGPLAFRCE